MQADIFSGGHLLGLLTVPSLSRPDLGPVVDPDDDHVLVQVGVLPQLLGHHDPALGIQLAPGGVGKEGTHGLGLAHGQGGELFGEAVPGGLGVDGKAGVHAHGQVEGDPQLLPQLGGDEEAALAVDTVFIGPGHALTPHLNGILWSNAPFRSTLLF